MPSSSFTNYLKQFSVGKGAPFTHTRIGDKELGVFGGLYNIPDDRLDEFYEKYVEFIIKGGGQEYLTEKQVVSMFLLFVLKLHF